MARSITGLSPVAEQMVQERMMQAAANRIDSEVRKELVRAYNDFAASYGNTGAMAEAKANHGERLSKILGNQYESVFNQFGRRILSASVKSKGGRETKNILDTPAFNLARQQWILLYGAQKVTEITGTTAKQAEIIINEMVAQAAIDGLSEAHTARLIRETMFEQGAILSRFRSRVIARTESSAAAQAANMEAANASELSMRKEWVASAGERTREAHSEANGQIRNLNEPFIVDGEQLMQPSDPNGSPSNVINCRCAVVFIPS